MDLGQRYKSENQCLSRTTINGPVDSEQEDPELQRATPSDSGSVGIVLDAEQLV